MSVELLPTGPTWFDRLKDAHRPRAHRRVGAAGLHPLVALLLVLAISAPFVVVALLVQQAGGLHSLTPNALLIARAAGLGFSRADPVWVAQLYPPITTLLASTVPGGTTGLSVVGALVAAVLVLTVVQRMRERGFAPTTIGVLVVVLTANPIFFYAATENLPVFLGVGMLGLGLSDLVRFTADRDTQSGFRAGITLMLAALSDPTGVAYVLVAAFSAPLLTAGRGRGRGNWFANTLVVLYPTAAAFLSVMALEWLFAGDPLSIVRHLVDFGSMDPALLTSQFTTPLGWLRLGTMGCVWVIALITGRPGAVVVTLLLFGAAVGGEFVGLIPATSAGQIYLMMVLAAIGLTPAARSARAGLGFNAVAGLMLALGWTGSFYRPVVVEWLQVLIPALR